MISLDTDNKNGIEAGVKFLKTVQKQTRFATAQALNATAREVQTFTTSSLLPSAFTLRSKGQPWQKPGGKYGFNIRPFANKNTLEARLGSQADWLKEQEEGGTKTAGSHRVAIPSIRLKTPAEIMAKNKKPAALLSARNWLDNGGVFLVAKQGDAGKLPPGIWARSSNKRLPITRLYSFKEAVEIKGILHFESEGSALAEKKFGENFATAFARALATAK